MKRTIEARVWIRTDQIRLVDSATANWDDDCYVWDQHGCYFARRADIADAMFADWRS